MRTNPLYDDNARLFVHAVDEAVEFLLPRGSGDQRTLRIEAEAVHPGKDPLRFGLLYCRPSNYTQVYVFVSGVEEIVLAGEPYNWRTLRSIPLAEVTLDQGYVLKGSEVLGSAKRTSPTATGLWVTIPGHLTSFADHDSCWRDKVREAFPAESDLYEYTEFRVLRVELKGLYSGQRPSPHPVGDRTWVNPSPSTLSSAFSVYTAMMALASAAGRQRVLHVEAAWRLYREESPPEQGTPEASGFNFWWNIRDISPRTPSYWCPLKGEALLVFDEQGRVISFGGQDIPPTALDRDFAMTRWDLPPSEDIYGLEFFGTTHSGFAFVGEKVRLDPGRTLTQPSLTIPPDRADD